MCIEDSYPDPPIPAHLVYKPLEEGSVALVPPHDGAGRVTRLGAAGGHASLPPLHLATPPPLALAHPQPHPPHMLGLGQVSVQLKVLFDWVKVRA